MTRYLTVEEVAFLHEKGIEAFGGSGGVRDPGLLESAVAQPKMAFYGQDAYPTLVEKAAALGFSLAKNHAFHDGNKRVAFSSVSTFLGLNGCTLTCTAESGEQVLVSISDGSMSRENFCAWILSETEVKDP